MEISDVELSLLRKFIRERVGIDLAPAKKLIVERRLQSLIETYSFSSFKHMYDRLKVEKNEDILSHFTDLISINVTSFFRESEHFDYLQKVVFPEMLNRLKKQNSRDLRIWCAATSSGEEAYTIAMCLIDYLGDGYPLWDAGVLGTDISSIALKTAKEGLYPNETLERVPRRYKRFFRTKDEGNVQVDPQLKKEVTFRRFNLITPNYPFKKPFHIIFCRNVMIYFDRENKKKLLDRLYKYTAPGGYLFVGHTESLKSMDHQFQYIIPSIYRRLE